MTNGLPVQAEPRTATDRTVTPTAGDAAEAGNTAPEDEAELATLAPPPASPWSDGLGRMAVRSGQILILALAALVAAVMVRLRLVVVPI